MKNIIALALFFSLGACSPPSLRMNDSLLVDVNAKRDRLPGPQFKVQDLSNPGQYPSYAHLRVFRVIDGCVPPGCPLVWHVITPTTRSPRDFYYGSELIAPGMITRRPALPLRRNGRYSILLSQNTHTVGSADARFDFNVTAQGRVKTVPVPKPVE